MVTTRFADGSLVANSFDSLNRRISTTDQNGKITRYRYDALGRLTGVQNALGDWTEYGYNELGNLIWQEDALDRRTRYEYDGLGRRTSVILPLNQRSTSVYDAVGNLSRYTDFNGNPTQFSYDALDRLTEQRYSDNRFHRFTYTPVGQRATVTDGRGVTQYFYNERDWLVSKIDPDGRTISYAYDATGNRTSLTSASGTVNYTFNERNWLDTVSQNGVTLADYDYDAVGNLTSTQFGNGTQELRQYDRLNRLTNLSNQKLNGDILSSYAYTLDKVGHRLQVTENSGRQVNYSYDDLYRLTQEQITDSANGNRTYGYSYDKVSNRLTKTETVGTTTTTTNYAYDANDRLLSETGATTATYTYDNNGNTLSKTENGLTTTYIWNSEPAPRMIGAVTTDANGVVTQQMSYQYDADGMRVSATVNGEETRYLLDVVQPYAQVREEYSPDGTVKVSYVYGNDLIQQTRGTDTTYYHVDGLGSTRILTDTQGQIVAAYNFDAYGELINSTGTAANNYLFAGEQYDANLGDYYLRQRYYSPSSGRFGRRDTWEGSLADPMSLHKYGYAHGNPVSFVDPSGLAAISLGGYAPFALISLLAASIPVGINAFVVGATVPQLGGFGEDSKPRSVLSGIMAWRNTWAPAPLGGFDGTPPDVRSHTGHSRDYSLNSLIRYIFLQVHIEAAYDIGYGHAWSDHINEWPAIGINSEQELAEHIEGIMMNNVESKTHGPRTAYWDESTQTIVIHHPGYQDEGTAFRPTEGKDYYRRWPDVGPRR